jgi:uncharacterized protein YecE (DUF72 family)
MDVKVGCCGFPKARNMYYKSFKVVEIQQTFYQPPKLRTLERWRMEAAHDFEFTLKAWQLITHESKSPTYRRLTLSWPKRKLERCGFFKPTNEVRWAWTQTREVAVALKARIVVFQTPPSFHPSARNKENMRKFFKEVNRGGLLLVWEPRGLWSGGEIQELCRELNLTHGVNPFKTDPSFMKIRYFRIHGITGYRFALARKIWKPLRKNARKGVIAYSTT